VEPVRRRPRALLVLAGLYAASAVVGRAPGGLRRAAGTDLEAVEGVIRDDVDAPLAVGRERLGVRFIRVRARDVPDAGEVNGPARGAHVAHAPLAGDEPQVPGAVG